MNACVASLYDASSCCMEVRCKQSAMVTWLTLLSMFIGRARSDGGACSCRSAFRARSLRLRTVLSEVATGSETRAVRL